MQIHHMRSDWYYLNKMQRGRLWKNKVVDECEKVLVVEDDTAIKTLLKYNLEQAGYQATTSSDGQVGYELALNNEYDFILLDVMLPNLDGLEITKRLRQEK